MNLGDVVKSKAGGPAMTIQDFEEQGNGKVLALCQWFVQDSLQDSAFPLETLEIENPVPQVGFFPKLGIGDLVRLRSGGPDLTIENRENQSGGKVVIVCHWFADGHKQVGAFASEVLEEAHPATERGDRRPSRPRPLYPV